MASTNLKKRRFYFQYKLEGSDRTKTQTIGDLKTDITDDEFLLYGIEAAKILEDSSPALYRNDIYTIE